MIKLLHRNKDSGDGISNFQPLMLNTALKILAKILASCLQAAMSSLICPEQTCVVKYSTIQDIHLVHLIIVDSEVMFFNWDPSRAFDKVDHKFLKAYSF